MTSSWSRKQADKVSKMSVPLVGGKSVQSDIRLALQQVSRHWDRLLWDRRLAKVVGKLTAAALAGF